MPPIIYFVRHGQTDWNVEGRLQGQRDIPLNDRGRAQASRCGDILQQLFMRDAVTPDRLDYVASPLTRASETMRLLRQRLGLVPDQFSTDDRLRELSFGAWEGFTIPELRVENAAAVAERERNKWGFVPPGGESYQMLTVRIRAWSEAVTRNVVAVAHGGTARAAFAILAGIPEKKAPNVDIDQGVVYRIADGRMVRCD